MAVTASRVQARCGGLRRGGLGLFGLDSVSHGPVWQGGHGLAVFGSVSRRVVWLGGLGKAGLG